MRRSICYCEPKYALAGTRGNWAFVYSPATTLPKGARIRFEPFSKGREVDWEVPQASIRKKENVIWMELHNGASVAATEITLDGLVAFEFQLPEEVPQGENLKIIMGTPQSEHAKEKGTRCQTFSQRKRTFQLSIDLKGKGDYKETEQFQLDVRGNHLSEISVVAPSLIGKNQRFDIIVRFEDAHGNLTGLAPEGTLVELTYDQLRDNISWKLFVPETGFVTLPNLYFNEPGIYRLKLKNLQTKEVFESFPIKCIDDAKIDLFWGSFHSEFELHDASVHVESALRYCRDELSMQFFATSPFESEEETPSEIWKHISLNVTEFNEDERFTTFLGMQWAGEEGTEGVHQIVHLKDTKPLFRKKDSKYNTLRKIYKSHSPKEIFGIPSFTMAKGVHSTFEEFIPEYEPVVEIYNAWGSSECLAKEGNTRPIYSKSKKGYNETDKGSIRNALKMNKRFGFVAGGFDDRGIYSHLYDTDQVQYSPGNTAIIATGHSREALFEALLKKSCFATTGARMLIGFEIAQKPMGSELNTTEKPGLIFNRHITGYSVGTTKLQEIALIRNGDVCKVWHPESDQFEFKFDDTELLTEISLKTPEKDALFTFYYLRATQEDGQIAWASPIWIDITDTINVGSKPKTRKKA